MRFIILLFFVGCSASPKQMGRTLAFQERDSMEMVKVEGGRFTMGSPRTEMGGRRDDEAQMQVTVSSFEIGKYEVTQGHWFDVMDNNPSYFSKKKHCRDSGYKEMVNARGSKVSMCEGHPVESFSWKEIQEFFRRLNQREGSAGCKINERKRGCWRLPTEAEWEYAARAGTTTRYSFGNASSGFFRHFFIGDGNGEIEEYAWYYDNAEGQTHRVGTRKPNPWGLYDVHGNVAELTMDGYAKERGKKHWDNPFWPQGKHRVVRGGGWDSYIYYVRSAQRFSTRHVKKTALGFRMVRSL